MNLTLRTNTIDKVNKLKEHLFNTYPDGKFSANGYTFNKIIGSGSTPYYLGLLVKDGFLKMIKKTTKEGKKWIPAEYEIVGCLVSDIKDENESNIEKDREIHSKIDVKDFIEENFNGVPMRLYKTEKGYVMPLIDIAKGLHTNWDAVNKIVIRNEELFNDYLYNPHDILSDELKSLTRDGVIGLLMKISYNRLSPDKKKLVLEFQKWAIEKLGQLMSNGEVKISNTEHNNVKVNIADTIGISNEDIEKMFTEIQKTVDEKLGMIKLLVDKKNKEVTSAKLERDMAIEREKRMMSRIPEIVDQRFELMMKKLA